MSADANKSDPGRRSGRRPAGQSADGKGQKRQPVIDPWLLLRSLRRRWLPILVLGALLAGAVGLAIWAYLPPGKQTVYRALRMSATQPSLAFEQGGGGGAAFDTFKSTQFALIRNRYLLSAALGQPKAAATALVRKHANPEECTEWLERELRVAAAGSPEIIHISLSGTAEEVPDLQVIVDAVTDEYFAREVDAEVGRREQHQKELERIAKVYEDNLTRIRKLTEQFRLEGASTDPQVTAMQQQLAAKEYALALEELTRRRNEIRDLKAQINQMEAGRTTGFTVSEAEVEAAVERDPAVVAEVARLEGLRRLIDTEAERAAKGRESTVVRSLQRQFDSAQEALKKKRGELAAGLKGRLVEGKNRSVAFGTQGLKERLAYLEGLEKDIVLDSEKLSKRVNNLKVSAIKLDDYKYTIEQEESMLRAIRKKAEVLKVERGAEPRVRHLNNRECAVVRPNEQTRKLMFSALGAVGSFGLVAFGLAFLEMRCRRLGPPAEISEQLGLTVVGALPYCKGGRNRTIAQRSLKEAIDGARVLLMHSGGEPLQAVLIASAAPGEGKTSLSCHLAASLSRAGLRTLLIDGDLRKPDAHAVFGKSDHPGLCDVLRGQCVLGQAVQPTGVAGLDLLAAGKWDDHAIRELGATAFAELMQEARGRYDFIVVDSSPLLAVNDALLLAKHLDGVVFAALQGETRLYRLEAASDRIDRIGGRLLGVIVNGIRGGEETAYHKYARYLAPAQKTTKA